MAAVKDSFLDLERHIQILERETEKLRNSLQEWQLWEAEYEALKEEVTSLPSPVSKKDLARIRRDFDGQFVNKKEVNEIFGRIDLKSADQIVSVLSRRLDYVSQNVETLEKQVTTAENKIAAAAVVSQPDVRHEDGEQVTDIIEQLDDDDNIVSFHLQTAANAQPQILEALEKAGIKDLPDIDQKPEPKPVDVPLPTRSSPSEPSVAETPPPKAKPDLGSSAKAATSKKGVSFADDTKPGHEPEKSAPVPRYVTTGQRLEQIMRAAKEQERMVTSSAVIPDDESVEDAAWRREALQYSMSEIGPVVAELQIEEGSDDEDDEGYNDSDEDDEDEDEEEDDEDEYGRSKYSLIDEEYRQRMMALEKKLSVTPFFAASKDGQATSVAQEAINRIVSAGAQPITAAKAGVDGKEGEIQKATSNPKNSVKFAEKLDIAPDEGNHKSASQAETEPRIDPLGNVVERDGRSEPAKQETSKRQSRFRAGRSGPSTSSETQATGPHEAPVRFLDRSQMRATPSGPEGQTLAQSLVEREPSAEVKEPSEFDAALLQQEVAEEYHRKRNRIIQQQGGFLKEKEAAITPLDEEEGSQKRVSRFKAARISDH